MNNSILIATVIVVAAVLVVAWLLLAQRRRERLKQRFGPEYDRALHNLKDEGRTESILQQRESRVSKYRIRPLSQEEAQRFGQAWRSTQATFVDDPSVAVKEADRLVTELMSLRGYPMSDFERRAEDLSVDHPQVVQHYRDAHAIAERHARGGASTEELRQALVWYRGLFEDLLDVQEPQRRRA